MKIVFLDESTLHSGELAVDQLGEFGELVCYPVTCASEVVGRCAGAHTVITNKVVMSAETIAACPGLKQIISCATGVNQIDLAAAKAHGVLVQNVAGYSTQSVAQHVWALILNLATSVHQYDRSSDAWPSYPIFTSLEHPVIELAGKVLGIVGLGEIGRAVARVGESFGMRVIALQRDSGGSAVEGTVERVCAAKFYKQADVVSLHCPLTEATLGMIDGGVLRQMKPTAMLINTARGPLIDEEALADALSAGEIAAAGLDVLSCEPPAGDNPLILYKGKNLVITPHTAWSAQEARQRLLDGLILNIESFQHGNPVNVVD